MQKRTMKWELKSYAYRWVELIWQSQYISLQIDVYFVNRNQSEQNLHSWLNKRWSIFLKLKRRTQKKLRDCPEIHILKMGFVFWWNFAGFCLCHSLFSSRACIGNRLTASHQLLVGHQYTCSARPVKSIRIHVHVYGPNTMDLFRKHDFHIISQYCNCYETKTQSIVWKECVWLNIGILDMHFG